MKRLHTCIKLTFVLFLLKAGPASAITGNDWQSLSEVGQKSYVVGVIDAWQGDKQLADPYPKEKETTIYKLHNKVISCIIDMPYNQMIVIVKKYMEGNPSSWHYSMASLVSTALLTSCGIIDSSPSK
jgi:hypothetical protein